MIYYSAKKENGDNMKLSVFYDHVLDAAKTQRCSIQDMLKTIKGFGYTAVECNHEHIAEDPAGFRTFLSQHGLQISCVCKWFNFGPGFDNTQIETFLNDCAAAQVKTVLVIPGLFAKDMDREKQTQNMLCALQCLCEKAEKLGIVVTLEDLDQIQTPFATQQQLSDVFGQIPALKFTCDTGNFYYHGIDLLPAFEKLQDRLVHVHLKDRSLKRLTPGDQGTQTPDGKTIFPAPTGSGVIPMREFLNTVLQTGYTGYFTVEHYGAANQLDFMQKSAGWMLDFIKSDEKAKTQSV